MNIEQKNTLFIVSLVSIVLVLVMLLSKYLIGEHVQHDVDGKLKKASATFVQAHDRIIKELYRRARTVNMEPSMRAAAMTGDLPTIDAMLQELLPHVDADFIAYYKSDSEAGSAGASYKPHLSAPKVLASRALTSLVRSLTLDREYRVGHAILHGEFFHLVALPVLNPLGGRVGVLVLGGRFGEDVTFYLQKMVSAEYVLFQRDSVIISTLSGMERTVQALLSEQRQNGYVSFAENGVDYYGKVFPLVHYDQEDEPINIMLAVSSEKEWGPYDRLTSDILLYILLLILCASLCGVYLSRMWLTRPIKAMAQMARRIGEQGFEVRVEEGRKDELGELAHAFNEMLNQLQQVRADESRSSQRFTDFAESSSDWLWETDREGVFTYVSKAVSSWLSVQAEELVGRSFQDYFSDNNMHSIMVLLTSKGHKEIKDVELWVTTHAGKRICMRISGTPYYHNKEFMGYRGTSRDITKIKNDEGRLSRLANKDHLSGLSNRGSFMRDLERELKFAIRQQTNGAMLQIGLDHFKLLNDTAGHAAGDEVIIQIAALLRSLTRETDLVARLSGDEFMIAFVNTDVDQVLNRARYIVKQIGQLKPNYGGKIINTTASIGVVLFPRHGANAAELLAKVDTAMNAAKRAGRDRAHLYEEGEMAQAAMGAQLTWKEKIHDALEDDKFVLAFQAVAPASGDPVSRYEVLVRMRAADGTIHMPGSFIPLAEELGLIHQIDTVVVRKALRVLNAVSRTDDKVSFSINLSGRSVGTPEMMTLIEDELRNIDIDRSRIIFEVTESAAFQDIGRAMGFISQIQSMGCRIALDDFGVGFSSFSYLKQLRADILKIDGSFIRDLHKDKHDQLFVKALVDVAKGMGMLTVAEFVENEQCLSMIREFGVDYAQGYYIHKPEIELFTE